MPPRTVVRLVPELSIAALKSKRDKELCLWLCLRAINYWGSGHLELETAVASLKTFFGYSESSVYMGNPVSDSLPYRFMAEVQTTRG